MLRACLLQPLEQLEAVQVGQVEVQHQHGERLLGIGLQCLGGRTHSGDAEAQLAQTRSQLDQQIQQASLQLDSLREQQRALDQAVMASQKHLEATRTGRQVGDRTPQDVLNAEQAVASLQHQRDQASTQYLLVWLQLAALKGQLNGQVLQQLSAS